MDTTNTKDRIFKFAMLAILIRVSTGDPVTYKNALSCYLEINYTGLLEVDIHMMKNAEKILESVKDDGKINLTSNVLKKLQIKGEKYQGKKNTDPEVKKFRDFAINRLKYTKKLMSLKALKAGKYINYDDMRTHKVFTVKGKVNPKNVKNGVKELKRTYILTEDKAVKAKIKYGGIIEDFVKPIDNEKEFKKAAESISDPMAYKCAGEKGFDMLELKQLEVFLSVKDALKVAKLWINDKDKRLEAQIFIIRKYLCRLGNYEDSTTFDKNMMSHISTHKDKVECLDDDKLADIDKIEIKVQDKRMKVNFSNVETQKLYIFNTFKLINELKNNIKNSDTSKIITDIGSKNALNKGIKKIFYAFGNTEYGKKIRTTRKFCFSGISKSSLDNDNPNNVTTKKIIHQVLLYIGEDDGIYGGTVVDSLFKVNSDFTASLFDHISNVEELKKVLKGKNDYSSLTRGEKVLKSFILNISGGQKLFCKERVSSSTTGDSTDIIGSIVGINGNTLTIYRKIEDIPSIGKYLTGKFKKPKKFEKITGTTVHENFDNLMTNYENFFDQALDGDNAGADLVFRATAASVSNSLEEIENDQDVIKNEVIMASGVNVGSDGEQDATFDNSEESIEYLVAEEAGALSDDFFNLKATSNTSPTAQNNNCCADEFDEDAFIDKSLVSEEIQADGEAALQETTSNRDYYDYLETSQMLDEEFDQTIIRLI